MGENPAMSDPNLNHAREALAMLDHLVVQDIFLTETAGFADVVLPASAFPEKTGTFTNTDRRVQLGRQAVNPPGDAKQDLWIIQQLANRLRLNWDYNDASDVFAEIRKAVPSMAGITWDRLEEADSLTYPLEQEGDPGEPVIFMDGFPTQNGKARFVPANPTSADELPDTDYPFVLITGRQLEHWHTGSMTRSASKLDKIESEATVAIHPDDITENGLDGHEYVKVESRRGEVRIRIRPDRGLQRKNIFIPFAYNEAAANLLTNQALDPFGKIPEFKYCAVKISPTD